GREGFVVRTGWNRGVDSSEASVAAPSSQSKSADAGTQDIQVILQRLTELESRVSRERQSRDSVTAAADTSSSDHGGSKLTDAEILRRVRDIVAESEKR